ncbi:hypothetical protein G6F58_012954 [Rhizopus delemar]|nr:hypothetical protein G6F58_012954 [Rhizopus delemar]
MTVVSEGPVSRTQAYQLLLGALRMRGFAVVESGGVSRVVPQADAKLLGGRVGAGGAGGEVTTRTFALRYENAAALVAVLRPMISPDNPITANPGNNTLRGYAGWHGHRCGQAAAGHRRRRSGDGGAAAGCTRRRAEPEGAPRARGWPAT